MGFSSEDFPGHSGYEVAVDGVGQLVQAEETRRIEHLQLRCGCGWRSPILLAPFGTLLQTGSVSFSRPALDDLALTLWKKHHLVEPHLPIDERAFLQVGESPTRSAGAADADEDDSRFTIGLLLAVADVLKRHGYPDLTAADLVELQQSLFGFLRRRPAR